MEVPCKYLVNVGSGATREVHRIGSVAQQAAIIGVHAALEHRWDAEFCRDADQALTVPREEHVREHQEGVRAGGGDGAERSVKLDQTRDVASDYLQSKPLTGGVRLIPILLSGCTRRIDERRHSATVG